MRLSPAKNLATPTGRRLTSKCLCRLTKAKAAEFFEGHQVGVACPGGSELIVHGLRDCIESHYWVSKSSGMMLFSVASDAGRTGAGP